MALGATRRRSVRMLLADVGGSSQGRMGAPNSIEAALRGHSATAPLAWCLHSSHRWQHAKVHGGELHPSMPLMERSADESCSTSFALDRPSVVPLVSYDDKECAEDEHDKAVHEEEHAALEQCISEHADGCHAECAHMAAMFVKQDACLSEHLHACRGSAVSAKASGLVSLGEPSMRLHVSRAAIGAWPLRFQVG